MTRFVQARDEVIENLLTLERYRVSPNAAFAAYYRGLIARGTCFVVYNLGGRTLFGPSRFSGYAHNSRGQHDANPTKHGGETNLAIQRVFRRVFHPNAALEARFSAFCHDHSIEPNTKRRRFMEIGEGPTPVDVLDADLTRIAADRRLTRTEKHQQRLARLGQGQFRDTLMKIWRRCPVTGCNDSSFLRASHIKPWRACSSAERLDPFNGLLLIPNLDLAFDQGFITFDQDGLLQVSPQLGQTDARALGIRSGTRIRFGRRHQRYLAYHRERVFRR